MSDAVIAQKAPYAVDVEAEKEYYWCTCGRSAKQPFCDRAHKDTGSKSLRFKAEETKTVFFCGCRHSDRKPLYDSSHNRL